LLASCGTTDNDDAAPAPAASSPSSSAVEPAPSEPATGGDTGASAAGRYITYADFDASSTDFASTDTVLFFHAGWCPKCQETESNLEADGVPDGLTVVKVDFDDSTELRQKYGVTLQHTFVQIDADGNEIAKWNGSYSGEDIAGKTT
jgi:thiol-disulfide isomerase/thioredoxin